MQVIRVLFIVFNVCVISAIVIQDFTGALPQGLFNAATKQYALLSGLCLAVAAATLGILILESYKKRAVRIAGWIRGTVVLIVVLDILLLAADQLLIGGNPGSRLGGPYYEDKLADGTTVLLRKSNSGLPLDFCPVASSESAQALRVLFLGDSYTEGSGSAPECNYTDVVQTVLRERWSPNARVMNAGVSAYGPVEALRLLRWYRERGCKFDAVVYNMFLENDFTDNLPNTERRAIAGVVFRFPESWFLRTFHPLNTRTFRWALFLRYMVRISEDAKRAVTVEHGVCDLTETDLATVSPFLRDSVNRRLSSSTHVAETPAARQIAGTAIREMKKEADELSAPFILVLFPHRALVDSQLQEKLPMDSQQLDSANKMRTLIRNEFETIPVIDATDVLKSRRGLYRNVDTHLSDLGNQVAGHYVGERLVTYLVGP